MNSDDFNWTDEGELLSPVHECGKAYECGCNRSLVGVETRKGTTLFEVQEIEMSQDDYFSYVAKYMEDRGFDSQYSASFAMDKGNELLHAADTFKVGTVVRREGYRFYVKHSKNQTV